MYQIKEELCERLIMIQQLKIAIKSSTYVDSICGIGKIK